MRVVDVECHSQNCGDCCRRVVLRMAIGKWHASLPVAKSDNIGFYVNVCSCISDLVKVSYDIHNHNSRSYWKTHQAQVLNL
jgi:hypothetical protein